MPTYIYFCENCKKEIEVFHSIKEELKKCPECNLDKFKKLIAGGSNFILNGGGWAKEGYS